MGSRIRPGGRSALVQSKVLAAAIELLTERGFERLELPEVARRAGVHPTTIYRRWETKARLVGEALLAHSQPLTPTPDTGSLRTDLERLLAEGVALMRTSPVRALLEVLLSEWIDPRVEVTLARDRFWAAHAEEVRTIVDRAVARGELQARLDPIAVIEVVIWPALLRALFMGPELGPAERQHIVTRALAALAGPAP